MIVANLPGDGPPRAAVAVKRALDIFVAAVGLAALAPLMAAIALLILRRFGRPVIFTQRRPGRDAREFGIRKFRTMLDLRDDAGALLPDADRLTRLGAGLRASSLDELPELWNVLKGDMSLVGPRPLLLRYTPVLTGEERLRFSMRPGITGLAQVNGRNDSAWTTRLAHDVWYVRNWSLSLDLKILALTLIQVLRGRGVVIDPGSAMLDLDVERQPR